MGVQGKNLLWVLASGGTHLQDMLSIRNVIVIYRPTNRTSMVQSHVQAVLQNAVCLMDQAKNIQLKINGCKQHILQYRLCYVSHTQL
jgi:hypothetical protein